MFDFNAPLLSTTVFEGPPSTQLNILELSMTRKMYIHNQILRNIIFLPVLVHFNACFVLF